MLLWFNPAAGNLVPCTYLPTPRVVHLLTQSSPPSGEGRRIGEDKTCGLR